MKLSSDHLALQKPKAAILFFTIFLLIGNVNYFSFPLKTKENHTTSV